MIGKPKAREDPINSWHPVIEPYGDFLQDDCAFLAVTSTEAWESYVI